VIFFSYCAFPNFYDSVFPTLFWGRLLSPFPVRTPDLLISSVPLRLLLVLLHIFSGQLPCHTLSRAADLCPGLSEFLVDTFSSSFPEEAPIFGFFPPSSALPFRVSSRSWPTTLGTSLTPPPHNTLEKIYLRTFSCDFCSLSRGPFLDTR